MARRTLEQLESSPADVDHERLAATTEDDIRRYMLEDGQDPDEDLPEHFDLVVPPPARARKARHEPGGVRQGAASPGPATLQDWEERGVFDPAVNSLLAIVYRMPEALKALAA